MLFFIFIALFAISVLAIIYTDEMSGWHLLATIAVVLTLIALLISTIGLASVYINADASVAKWETQYESLTYQLENNLYDNDNDIGKKELMDEIREWNGNLAYCKEIQRNFWVGIYYPNVYDNFEFIPLP
jgi:type VI protein secretion system component VasK